MLGKISFKYSCQWQEIATSLGDFPVTSSWGQKVEWRGISRELDTVTRI